MTEYYKIISEEDVDINYEFLMELVNIEDASREVDLLINLSLN